ILSVVRLPIPPLRLITNLNSILGDLHYTISLMRKLYKIVGLGGTFDHFHIGHEHFIKFANQFSQQLHIGITHTQLTQAKPFAELIQPYKTRKYHVEKFCKSQQVSVAISQLNDVYGPAISETSKIQALVVTEETIRGADKINEARKAIKLHQLPVHICPMLRDETGKIISSERIRAGEINGKGAVYRQLFKDDLTLNELQHNFFSQPQGEIINQPNLQHSSLVCVVGDASLKKFIQNNWHYNLGVYDRKQQRQHVEPPAINSISSDLDISNPAGQISNLLVQSLETAIKQQLKHLFVEGEEDLAAVALVLLLPLGSKIYYGQPDQGLIEMIVTEEKKDQFYQILNN
ncbi:pantetheine-phosphate adenylyltransferase, partial [Patescibacteria group bacterium]|nr:pantetheine-phosphate adenylyltransferase [Patescibacteria group bacterium]